MSKVLKMVLGGMLVTQSVWAQPGGAAAPAAPAPATPAPSPTPAAPVPTPTPPPSGEAAPAATEVDMAVRQRSTLSPQDMITQAREYRAKAAEVLQRIEGQQEQAKKEKDIIRLNCLTDKLVQAKVNINIADTAIVSLEDAVRRRDEGASLYEYTRVTIVHQKAQVLENEAQQCVGEDLSFVGATRVDVEVDPSVRTDDPTAPGGSGTPVDRPPVASSFQ
jgi:hypothetical protein